MSTKKVSLNIPLTIINTGGKPDIVKKIYLELQREGDKPIILQWNKIIEKLEIHGSEAPKDIAIPLLINANSSETKYYNFESIVEDTVAFWVPKPGTYIIKARPQLSSSKKMEVFTVFNFTISAEESMIYSGNLTYGNPSGKEFYIKPDKSINNPFF